MDSMLHLVELVVLAFELGHSEHDVPHHSTINKINYLK
jgi:hypothetical protein